MAEKVRYNKIIDLLEHGKPVFSTSTVPIPCCFMALAAADTDSPGARQTGAADMMSRTFLIVLHLLR